METLLLFDDVDESKGYAGTALVWYDPTVAVREHGACGNPPVEAALGIAQLSATIPPPRAAVDCAPASTGNARKFCK